MFNAPIHSLRVNEVLTALETSQGGLSDGEAQARRRLYGDNILVEMPHAPVWRTALEHTAHPMAILLWAAGGAAALGGDIVLGLVIWAVVVVNAGFSFWREYRANQAIAVLQNLLPHYARSIRDGHEIRLSASELVVGDLLILAEGDHIPADCRIIEEYGLRVDNSTLTGESVPARKIADASLRSDISDVERPNLIFAGTSVVSGTGRAVVFATGMLTQFGRLARLTQAVQEPKSRLQLELMQLTRKLSVIAFVAGILAFLAAILDVGLDISDAFLLEIGVFVAIVPEGLPATITLALAAAGQRLAQKGVLVKKLANIETLGTVSVICTDKSGTLTQNQMTVRRVWTGGQDYTISGVGYEPVGHFTPPPKGKPGEDDLRSVLIAAMLCNNARLMPPSPDHPQWTCLGDQTEAALRVAALKMGLDDVHLNEALPRVHELPFDARRKRMSTIHQVVRPQTIFPDVEPGNQIAFVKGAPREILHLCTKIFSAGKIGPLDDRTCAEIQAVNDEYARGALRVLGLARAELPGRAGGYSAEIVEKDLTFLGLIAMMDPPRPEVAEAIQRFRQAGIRMIMITGDYGLTAESLARRVGMLDTPNTLIYTGADLDQMSDDDLTAILDKDILFARMAPEHKLRLVSAFQSRKEVVAVTGDGVNDAPALRKADIGFAMGITGTDVAKEAADIILTDDNFAAIADAVQEGRAVYENLRKFMTYIFSSNIPEVLPFALSSLIHFPLTLTVKQVLAIDLGTDIFPALALGLEKPEPDIMQRPPRNINQPLVDRPLLVRAFLWLGVIEALLCYAGFFFVYDWMLHPWFNQFSFIANLNLGISPDQRYPMAMTVFYAGVVMSQVGNAFACRTERNRGRFLGWLSNPLLILGIAVELLMLFVLVYSPLVSGEFKHVLLPKELWLGLMAYPVVLYGMDWLQKGFSRWLGRARKESMA